MQMSCINPCGPDTHAKVIHRLNELGFTNGGTLSPEETANLYKGRCIVVDLDSKSFGHHINPLPSYFPNICKHLSAFEFFNAHGWPEGAITSGDTVAPSVCTSPDTNNPPNFAVDCGGVEQLSEIVQNLAFKAGMKWLNAGNSPIIINNLRILVSRVSETKFWLARNTLYTFSPKSNVYNHNFPLYSAATQMGEIVRLFSTPVAQPPTPPEIHGYTAVYTAGAPTVDFGCAKIDVGLLQDANQLMEEIRPSGGNRQVFGITLSSGKTLSREQIAKIMTYVTEVKKMEDAKKSRA